MYRGKSGTSLTTCTAEREHEINRAVEIDCICLCSLEVVLSDENYNYNAFGITLE